MKKLKLFVLISGIVCFISLVLFILSGVYSQSVETSNEIIITLALVNIAVFAVSFFLFCGSLVYLSIKMFFHARTDQKKNKIKLKLKWTYILPTIMLVTGVGWFLIKPFGYTPQIWREILYFIISIFIGWYVDYLNAKKNIGNKRKNK